MCLTTLHDSSVIRIADAKKNYHDLSLVNLGVYTGISANSSSSYPRLHTNIELDKRTVDYFSKYMVSLSTIIRVYPCKPEYQQNSENLTRIINDPYAILDTRYKQPLKPVFSYWFMDS